MKKNLLHVMAANIFYMIVVAATNFILPRFTTVETYAAVKSYTLYVSTYAEIVTLGYIQGVYIRYGGKKIESISNKEIGSNLLTFMTLLLPIAGVVSIIGVVGNDIALTMFGAGLLASEVVMYFQFLYQATGEFKVYGIALNGSKVLVFFTYLILIWGFPKEIQALFVMAAPMACIFVAIYLCVQLNRRTGFLRHMRFSFVELKTSIKDGFVIMVGNFVTSFFTTIDRWFVKVLMATIHFAYYSFAVSLENIVNTFMRPITVSMYNYFCHKPLDEDVRHIKDYSIMYSFIVIASAYPAKWILETFMPDYLPASAIIFPLFAAQAFATVIKGIYINKYKADGKQNQYFFQMLGVLILAIIMNGVLYFIFKSMVAIAAATLITNILWFVYCESSSPHIRCKLNTYIAIIIMLLIYLFTGHYMGSIVGCVLYCAAGLLCSVLLMNKTFKFLVTSVISTVLKKGK